MTRKARKSRLRVQVDSLSSSPSGRSIGLKRELAQNALRSATCAHGLGDWLRVSSCLPNRIAEVQQRQQHADFHGITIHDARDAVSAGAAAPRAAPPVPVLGGWPADWGS